MKILCLLNNVKNDQKKISVYFFQGMIAFTPYTFRHKILGPFAIFKRSHCISIKQKPRNSPSHGINDPCKWLDLEKKIHQLMTYDNNHLYFRFSCTISNGRNIYDKFVLCRRYICWLFKVDVWLWMR